MQLLSSAASLSDAELVSLLFRSGVADVLHRVLFSANDDVLVVAAQAVSLLGEGSSTHSLTLCHAGIVVALTRLLDSNIHALRFACVRALCTLALSGHACQDILCSSTITLARTGDALAALSASGALVVLEMLLVLLRHARHTALAPPTLSTEHTHERESEYTDWEEELHISIDPLSAPIRAREVYDYALSPCSGAESSSVLEEIRTRNSTLTHTESTEEEDILQEMCSELEDEVESASDAEVEAITQHSRSLNTIRSYLEHRDIQDVENNPYIDFDSPVLNALTYQGISTIQYLTDAHTPSVRRLASHINDAFVRPWLLAKEAISSAAAFVAQRDSVHTS